jgi:hypothetical protein
MLISLVARMRGGATLRVQPTRRESLNTSATTPYCGNSSELGTSGGSTQRYQAVPKSGLGLVCFYCGDKYGLS